WRPIREEGCASWDRAQGHMGRSGECFGTVQQKNVIQYPHFTKLIIYDLMDKHESILKILKEDYHTIKDDTPLVTIYTTREVTVRGILIPDDILTNAIRDTQSYKDYEAKYGGADVLIIQSQSAESTLGTNRIPRATKTPNPDDKPSTTTSLPPSDDRERDEIHEATQLSIALDKTTKAYKEQQNVAEVEERLLEEDIEKLVKGDEESTAILLSDEDSGDRLEPGSHKENLKKNDDDDDDEKKDGKDADDHDDHALIRTRVTSAQVVELELWDVLKANFEKSSASASSCRDDAFRKCDHDEHQGYDAPPKGEKSVKRQKMSKSSKSARAYYLSKQSRIPKHLHQIENKNNKIMMHGLMIQMEAIIKYMINNQFRGTEEYAYHVEQAQNYLENQIIWESRLEDLKRPNPDALVFYHPQRNLNKPPSDNYQQYGLDYMERIVVMRENDKPDSFSEADFKYLNKNDIEDMYYIFLKTKINHENKLLNSLLTFIRSFVIWDKVYDFQLGIESYQIKINITAPTLTFLDIEACDPFSIVDKTTTGLIYLNSKNEKRFMDLEELLKFCDATLEKRNNEASKASRADEKVRVVREWKPNSTDDEASRIINP
nr:hypothetical protein [Tanacetum cinerariifolium]